MKKFFEFPETFEYSCSVVTDIRVHLANTRQWCVMEEGADDGVGWAEDILFYLNGCMVELHQPDPTLTLAEYLRQTVCLTATKVGCGQGFCGTPLSLFLSFFLCPL